MLTLFLGIFIFISFYLKFADFRKLMRKQHLQKKKKKIQIYAKNMNTEIFKVFV